MNFLCGLLSFNLCLFVYTSILLHNMMHVSQDLLMVYDTIR